MLNKYNAVMSCDQSIKLEGLRVTLIEIQRFAEETRLQSQTPSLVQNLSKQNYSFY